MSLYSTKQTGIDETNENNCSFFYKTTNCTTQWESILALPGNVYHNANIQVSLYLVYFITQIE